MLLNLVSVSPRSYFDAITKANRVVNFKGSNNVPNIQRNPELHHGQVPAPLELAAVGLN